MKTSTRIEEDETEEPGISKKQAIIYGAIVLACFAAVYPQMIHPMVKAALGFGPSNTQTKQQQEMPPQMMNRGKPIPAGVRPPPGARGEVPAAETGSKGMGGGIMAMILPVYAIGIVIYLLYTASKVYGGGDDKKKKKKRKGGDYDEVYSMITERLSGLNLEKVLSGEDIGGAEEINKLAEYLRQKNGGEERPENWIDDLESVEQIVTGNTPRAAKSTKKTKKPKSEISEEKHSEGNSTRAEKTGDTVDKQDDTDELLRKCENHEFMTPDEMRRLQSRLLEVEGRMNKLMSAIKTVGTKTDDMAEQILNESSSDTDDEDNCALHQQRLPSTNQKLYKNNLADQSDDDDPYDNHSEEEEEEGLSAGDDGDESEGMSREEVEEVYAQIESSGDEMVGAADDSEMGGVRRRRFPTLSDSEDES